MSISKVANEENWEVTAQICRHALHQSIPHQWALSSDRIPAKERLNVMELPYESGLLTTEELKITEMDVPALLAGYKSGTLSVVQVTTAFLKRAVIGQQLVNTRAIQSL